ncbi:MAG: peptidoglycan editing factor PgeF [Sedimentisphaerales bacterium]|nr:peptidoglycan editing factor PgeF [Sedimentisphaerales bacterium]
MREVKKCGIRHLVFEGLSGCRRLRHGVSLRRQEFGEFDFSRGKSEQAGDGSDQCSSNLNRFCQALELDEKSVVQARQVHGAKIAVIEEAGQEPGLADGLCTKIAGVPLMMVGADCPLVVVFDPIVQVLGMAHAGWRGTVEQIVRRLVETMADKLQGRPEQMLAGIGPGICRKCFMVGEDVITEVMNNLAEAEQLIQPIDNPAVQEVQSVRGGQRRWNFDLARANQKQLMAVGLAKENIELSGCCTFEQIVEFPSYRRDGKSAGRWALIAGLAKKTKING